MHHVSHVLGQSRDVLSARGHTWLVAAVLDSTALVKFMVEMPRAVLFRV